MSSVRAGQPGATRLCPHCKATVLESATVCQGCRHHLRFNGGKQLAVEAYTSFSVDGTIAHRQRHEPCEYCIVLQVTNERGEQILRQVVGVGALQAGEQRRLNVTVDMLPLVVAVQPRPAAAAGPATGAIPAAAAASSASSSAIAREPPRPSLGPRGSVQGSSGARPGSAAAAGSAPAAGSATAAGSAAPAPATPGATVSTTGPAMTVPGTTSAKPATAGKTTSPGQGGRSATSATPASGSSASSTKGSGTPDPGATLGQRLRIFRKP